MIRPVIHRLRGMAWQCVRSWRTTSCAAGIIGALGTYLMGHISTDKALVIIGAMSAFGSLFAKDAARP